MQSGLDLVSILLQGDAYQLAARPHASFGEELLQAGFDRAFRNLQAISNLFVGQTFKAGLARNPELPAKFRHWLAG